MIDRDYTRPNKRRFAFALFLLTGALPWGVELTRWHGGRSLSRRISGEWPLCCGHVMRDAEVSAWKQAGLLVDAAPIEGRPTVEAGPRLQGWVSTAFDGMRVHSWGREA